MIYNRNSALRRWIIPATIFLLIIGAFFLNYRYVSANPGGSDFLVQWVGTKMLVVNEMNPYDQETTQAIQQQANINQIRANEGDLQFRYPLFSVVIFSFFALIPDFLIARAFWMLILEAALILFCWISLRLFALNTNPPYKYAFLLILIFGFHGVFPVINGDVVVLVSLFLILSMLLIKNGGDEIAGVLIALTTIKGQPLILFYIFLFYWVFRNQRWGVLAWFLITLVLLITSSALFIPRWILDYIGNILQNPPYSPYSTPGQALAALWFPEFGIRIGWILSIMIIVFLFFEWRNVRSDDFGIFSWMSALSIVSSQWVGIQSEPVNYLVLYPGLALVLANISGRWDRRISNYFLIGLALISIGIWLFYYRTIEFYLLNQALHPGFVFFLPIVAFVGLFWIRWWMLYSSQRFSDPIY